MASLDPSLFYTGLVAQLYAPLRSSENDPEPYARFIRSFGEPALELGCGDGDPMLELRRRGLDVEGLDASPDMLERCRGRAAADGLEVTLHESAMETMDLGRRFRTIYLAGPTFNLLPDDERAGAALTSIAAHLDPAGAALIPLFIPTPIPADALGTPRRHEDADGAEMRISVVSATRDDTARLQTALLRYELQRGTDVEVLERDWLLHWHTQDSFRELVAAAGLTTSAVLDSTGQPAEATAKQFSFLLKPA